MLTRRRFLLSSAAITAGSFAYWSLLPTNDASAAPVFTGDEDGVAINGYDTVAYLILGKPVKGSVDFVEQWRGVDWHFSSAEHQRLFASNPEKYAPKYGGYCAYAVAHGYTAKTEPEAFSVVKGQLYLNYDLSIRSRWEADRKNFIGLADSNWPKLNQQ